MRDWGGIPTEDDKLRVREATGVKDPGKSRVVRVIFLLLAFSTTPPRLAGFWSR